MWANGNNKRYRKPKRNSGAEKYNWDEKKKITRGKSKADLNRQKKESANLKVRQWTWPQLRSRKKKIVKKSEQSLWSHWTLSNKPTCIVGVTGEERGKGAERKYLEKMVENFPNMMKYINVNIEEAQGTVGKVNLKKSTLWHIVKFSKDKDMNHHTQGILNKIMGRFLTRNFGGQKTVGWYIQSAKKNCQPRIISAKTILQKCESKTLPNTQKLKEFTTIILALQEMLKGVLQGEMKGHQTVTNPQTFPKTWSAG